ncbi:MAG: hypothetical protein RR759_08105 [Ruthenibacterium sp.]
MKIKQIALVCAVAMLCTACAAPAAASSAAQSVTAVASTNKAEKSLEILLSGYGQNMQNDNGFYTVECPQSNLYQNLMYYDYQTRTQRYVCDKPDCTHDSKECTSYLSTYGGVFPVVFHEKLYVIYQTYDDGTPDRNAWKPAIEQRNLDGTGAEIVMQGDERLRMNSAVMTDGDAWYYTVGSARGNVLMRFSPTEKTLTEVGVLQNNLMMIDAAWNGKQLALQYGGANNDPADGTNLYAVSLQDGSAELLYTWAGEKFSFTNIPLYDGKFLYTDPQNGSIRAYDLASDTDAVFTDIFAKHIKSTQNGMCWGGGQIIGDWMFVQGEMTFAGNLKTGEVKEITLEDFWNGYVHPINIWCETPHGVLVTEEHRPRTIHSTGNAGEPMSFESDFNVYALMDVEDLVNSVPNYREIEPVAYAGVY